MAQKENLQTELDVRRAEYELKRRDLELKEGNDSKFWRRGVLVPVLIGSLAVLGNAGGIIYNAYLTRDTQNELLRNSGLDELFAREHTKLLSVVDLPEKRRMSLICRWYRNNLFQHGDSIELMKQTFSAETRCSSDGYPISPVSTGSVISADNISLEKCKKLAAPLTASCKAYDKSGFHSRPSASCTIELKAGDDRFFAADSVTVVSEHYRKRSGNAAADSVVKKLVNGVVRSFSGSIACTNDKGTGRTCEARATVQANSYPDSCLGLRDSLKDAE